MKVQKVKVWWQKVDENGTEIERGCDNREYVNWGCARNRAEKLFGKPRYRKLIIGNETEEGVVPRIKWRISHRDPWTDYFEDRECDICGAIHKRRQTEHGWDVGDSFWMSRSKNDPNYTYRGHSAICPTCADKLVKCIKRLEKGGRK